MRIVDDYTSIAPFEISAPEEQTVPFVFSAPHSGAVYPREFLRRSRLGRQTIRRSEDTFVDALFTGVTALGAPILKANFPRVYVDLNRAEGELDPAMFDGPLNQPLSADSPRVAGGLGVIARIVGERQEIYNGLLPAREATHRIETFYRPYHQALADLIERTVDSFGTCALVDCHSMPSGAIAPTGGSRPDIILGDRFGTSCSPALAESLAVELRAAGFVVGRNRPYAGGFITEHYGRPPVVHAIQLEINRALYMDEATYVPTTTFAQMQDRLMGVCRTVIDDFVGTHLDGRWPLAAE